MMFRRWAAAVVSAVVSAVVAAAIGGAPAYGEPSVDVLRLEVPKDFTAISRVLIDGSGMVVTDFSVKTEVTATGKRFSVVTFDPTEMGTEATGGAGAIYCEAGPAPYPQFSGGAVPTLHWGSKTICTSPILVHLLIHLWSNGTQWQDYDETYETGVDVFAGGPSKCVDWTIGANWQMYLYGEIQAPDGKWVQMLPYPDTHTPVWTQCNDVL